MSGCAALPDSSSAIRIMPAHTPHTGLVAANSRVASSMPERERMWPWAVDSPPGRMSASRPSRSSAERTSTPSTDD